VSRTVAPQDGPERHRAATRRVQIAGGLVYWGAGAAALGVVLLVLGWPALALGSCAVGAGLSCIGIRRQRAILARGRGIQTGGTARPR